MQKISAGIFKNFSHFFFLLAFLFLTLTACQFEDSSSHNLSEKEISAFTDWMHQLRFHETIPREEALSSGAVTYYHISLLDGSKLTISPGKIMQINDTYYRLNTEVSTIKPPC